MSQCHLESSELGHPLLYKMSLFTFVALLPTWIPPRKFIE